MDPLWDPLGSKMAPKITLVAPKLCPKLNSSHTLLQYRKRAASRIAFGALLAPCWSIFDGFGMDCSRFFDVFWGHFRRCSAAFCLARFSQLLSKQTARTSRKLQKHAEHLQRTSKKLARNAKNLRRPSKNPPNRSQKHKRHIACFDATAPATNAELQNRGRRCSRR